MCFLGEFRDGNVPAGYDLLRPFRQALELVPAGVSRVHLRSDSAAYGVDLLKYCAEGRSERFGVIEFAIGIPVTEAFTVAAREIRESSRHRPYKMVDGKPLDTGEEWAEVCFVPSWVGHKKHGPTHRYVAIHEPLEQQALCGMEDQFALPFPTIGLGALRYKVTAIVTNRGVPADELIWWYRGRCSKSEEAHSITKTDLGGGMLP